MRSRRPVPVFVLLASAAAACAPSAPPKLLAPEVLGIYRFEEILAPDQKLEGTFVVGQDSIAIDANPGPCRYERDRSNSLSITYTCGDVAYTFDRSSPVRRASYSAIVHLKESRSVCARYAVSNGKQVCAEMRSETYFRDARRGGLLRPERVDDVQ